MLSKPIDASLVAQAGVRTGQLQACDGRVYWCERRPEEKGRQTIVCWENGEKRSLLPAECSARSKVHEYGGGDYLVAQGMLFFVNDSDQAIYQLPLDGLSQPTRVSDLLIDCDCRYADLAVSPDGHWLVAVRERHLVDEVKNDLVAFSLSDPNSHPKVLVDQVDFVASPRFSPGGHQLAWLTWDTQAMSWERSDVYLGQWEGGMLSEVRCCSFDEPCSYLQPTWSSSGDLYVSCDLAGQWEVYVWVGETFQRVCALPGECGYPAWVFCLTSFCVSDDGAIIGIVGQPGQQRLCRITDNKCEAYDLPHTDFDPTIAFSHGKVFYKASSSQSSRSFYALSLGDGSRSVIGGSSCDKALLDSLVQAKPISFLTDDGESVHAFYYQPKNAGKNKPPLIVNAHGGPTAHSTASLSWTIQYWVSRGFAYLDVNYRGSTGYGRDYRRQLLGRWGELDDQDCCLAARYVIDKGWVDPACCFIRGGSAGGLTVLNAMRRSSVFAGGVSAYGVVDLETLQEVTHKFEASYLLTLVGSLPESEALYRERSPLHDASSCHGPVLFLQGLKDAVVPPSQVKSMMAAMDAADKPYSYHAYPDEGHGFRLADNIIDALEREEQFYREVMAKKVDC